MRKAQSQYISWIIIIAMVVAISYFLYDWTLSQAQKTTDDISVSTDPLDCSGLKFQIEGICQSFNSLKFNITNIKTQNIEGFQVRTLGLYPDEPGYVDEDMVYTSLSPGITEKMTILKTRTLSLAKFVPVTKKENRLIFCEDQSVVKEINELKTC